jgi:hypothetical protein
MAPRKNATAETAETPDEPIIEGSKVESTTILKDPKGRQVKLKAGEPCPVWAQGRVKLQGDDETPDAGAVTDET